MTASSQKIGEGDESVAEIRGLCVETAARDLILEDVSLSLRRGETLGVVGESGSGKTTTGLSLLGYTQGGSRITAGEIAIDGALVPVTHERAMRRTRGRSITYVPQNPGTSLNPSMRIGTAVTEMLRAHREDTAQDGLVSTVLTSVGLPGEADFQQRYPHQLSGGQQQRVCIAIAVACEPPIVVLDEPTTGLDVVTQATILTELTRLRRERGISMIYIAHDLAVVAQVAHRIAVMYAGRVIEQGPAQQILRRPRHPYTRGLLTSIPDHIRPRVLQPMIGVSVGVGERPRGCSFAPRCPLRIDECEQAMPELRAVEGDHLARCVRAEEVTISDPPPLVLGKGDQAAEANVLTVSNLRAEHRGRGGTVTAARDITFSIGQGRCVALVGESGSGKTTIARAIAGLHPLAGGEIKLAGESLDAYARRRTSEQRRRVQMIFQNPSDALNPRQTVRTAVARPTQLLRGLNAGEAEAEVRRLLEVVRLPQRLASRYPSELSGGERQRVGIARALAARPDLIICDEVTSALDVSVQAAVLKLLDDLRTQLGLALLFITHDLGVVAAIADSVLVLERGDVCEAGPVRDLLNSPEHPYTKRLLAAAPSITTALAEWAATDANADIADPVSPAPSHGD